MKQITTTQPHGPIGEAASLKRFQTHRDYSSWFIIARPGFGLRAQVVKAFDAIEQTCGDNLSNSIPIFFINRESRTDRRTFMEDQLDRLGLSATRIAASEPEGLDDQLLHRYCNPAAAYVLSPQQLCCTISHTKAWEKLLASGRERALILEDDAVLSDTLPSFLEQLPTMPFDLIRIESPLGKLLVQAPISDARIAGVGFRKFRSTGWGAAGYVITSEAASRLLSHPKLYDLPTDAALFCPLEQPAESFTMVQTDPALCIQLKNKNLNWHDVPKSFVLSDISVFLTPTSWLGHMTRWRRHTRWAAIKVWEKLTRRDLRRRLIPFQQKSEFELHDDQQV